ncbi:MAG: hypothetical protein ACJ77A_11195 [Actinomycetota bacterium]
MASHEERRWKWLRGRLTNPPLTPGTYWMADHFWPGVIVSALLGFGAFFGVVAVWQHEWLRGTILALFWGSLLSLHWIRARVVVHRARQHGTPGE